MCVVLSKSVLETGLQRNTLGISSSADEWIHKRAVAHGVQWIKHQNMKQNYWISRYLYSGKEELSTACHQIQKSLQLDSFGRRS